MCLQPSVDDLGPSRLLQSGVDQQARLLDMRFAPVDAQRHDHGAAVRRMVGVLGDARYLPHRRVLPLRTASLAWWHASKPHLQKRGYHPVERGVHTTSHHRGRFPFSDLGISRRRAGDAHCERSAPGISARCHVPLPATGHDLAKRDATVLSHPRRFARRDQRGQAILAALFILGYLGLLTIVFLNYASVTQGQYGRTEQTAKQNASIEGAIDAGLVAAGRDTQLSCATGRSSGTGTLKFPAGTGSGPLSANQLFPAAQTLNPLTFSYDKCYPNGAIGPPGGRGGLLQPACVVCTLSNVSPSLTVGGSGSVQFRVQGPIWANDTLSLQGGNAKIQSTKVTSWKPPPPCN